METEKLYYTDPFLKEFSAKVLTCEAVKTGWEVVLDQTAFYPEGGGQPADHGTLNGVSVFDVHEKNGVLFHICENPVEIGETVTGQLDWARRFDHMQQHSGEHILSGILCEAHDCDNVGFHMGADTITIDYNADISWEQALEAERRANEYIWADVPIDISFPTPEELKSVDYRSKKELTGQVRIVSFPGADCCACCGTHVLRSGQVGLVKILSCQKFREGVRLEILCGGRAFALLSTTWEQSRTVGRRLSVKPQDAAEAVERLEMELNAAKTGLTRLEDALFERIAAQETGRGNTLLFQPTLRPDGARKLADAVSRTCGGLAAVFAGEDGQYQYALLRADGKDIDSLVRTMNAALHGRGGGRNGFAQGSVHAKQAEIEAFFKGAF
ncbi:alanine--tRNA ligase-related protein [Oscillibacter sp.]|uniref:alanyl-tRNA editing protein n=1 Tax=Oscillibacter sp. TaxID=1945593 RepID=UPI002899A47E|nr:alanine--tRNA ligase-related protein [Oscillibacter sp.]